jgi:hypothetical protein
VDEGVYCGGCGIGRADQSPQAVRQPCPACKSTSLMFVASLAEYVRVSAELTLRYQPDVGPHGLQERWRHLEKRGAAELGVLLPEPATREGLVEARNRLLGLLVELYSFKDALKVEARNFGHSEQDVEDAVTKSPHLALLADLANQEKHVVLNSAPRSGFVPAVGPPSALFTSGQLGWTLGVEISHGSGILDACSLAQAALNEWEQLLRSWGAF